MTEDEVIKDICKQLRKSRLESNTSYNNDYLAAEDIVSEYSIDLVFQ